jgi:hypothetical protein
MDHLDIVASTTLADYTHARFALPILGCDFLQKWEHLLETRFVTSWAHRRTSSSRLVATADTATNVADSCVLALVLSSFGVCEVLVTAVEDDVSLGQLGHETLKHLVTDTSVG